MNAPIHDNKKLKQENQYIHLKLQARFVMKKIIHFSLLAAVFIILIAAVLKNTISDKQAVSEQPPVDKQNLKIDAEQKKVNSEIEKKQKKTTRFKSNDEIKKQYGKIETVHLWNGKTYTGAVINNKELYSIVTIEGVIKIPMKDVKIREIIR
jgi:uncharacterized protein YlxW (UPF0749 family)